VVRVLVVDDSVIFRHFISEALEGRPGFQAVGEASDGLEAVQKAEELQPDLILLDIGLPKLNGIETAKRVCQIAPGTKILFVSMNRDAEVVEVALSSGGLGYVAKSDTGSELWSAIETVLQGKRFVSSSLAGQVFVGTASEEVNPLPRQDARIIHRHEVAFYRDDDSLVGGFSRFIEDALGMGSAVIVIATESHRARLLERLSADRVDVGVAIERGSYIPLDVADTLSTFMANDLPDSVRFLKMAGDLVRRAAKAAKRKHPRVAACGECAPILLAEGKEEAVVQLEHLWDEIARRFHTDILCGYLSSAFQGVESRHILPSICAKHSAVHGQTSGL